MYKLNRKLEGGKHYDGRTNKNPITPKQLRIIKFIQEELSVKFTGSSSKQAYDFIQKYYETARLKSKIVNSIW